MNRFTRRLFYNVRRFWYGMMDPNSPSMWAFALRHRKKVSRVPPDPLPAPPQTISEDPRSPRQEPVLQPSWPHVPRIIFQSWKSRTQIPSNFRTWSNSFKRYNPDYDCLVWDDHDNRDFIAEQFAWFLPFYDEYPKEIFRVDAVRFFFLYKFGGLYADMDTECLKRLDPVLEAGDVIVGRMGADKTFEHSIPNAMMAAKPRHLLWLLAITMCMEKFKECSTPEEMERRGPETLTGPILLKTCVDTFNSTSESEVRARASWVIDQVNLSDLPPLLAGNLEILPPKLWYPVDWTNPFHRPFRQTLADRRMVLTQEQTAKLFPDSYLVTYWSHSW